MIDTTNTISPEWQNENALRSYPLEDDAPAAEVVPTWLISDLRITVDAGYAAVFLSSAYISDTIVSVGISGCRTYQEGGVTKYAPPEGLLTKTVTLDELEPFRTYSMERLSGLASGVIAFGDPTNRSDRVKLVLSRDEAPLVPSSVVRVRVPGVTRIVDESHGLYATGIIDLSGNSEFRTYLGPDNTIIVELSDMYRDMTTSVCNAYPSFDTCGETPVKTINGVGPYTSGAETGIIKLKFT